MYPLASETFVWEPVRWLQELGCAVSVVTQQSGVLPPAVDGIDNPPPVAVTQLSAGRRLGSIASGPMRALRLLPKVAFWPPDRCFDSLSQAMLPLITEADVLLAHFGDVGVDWLPAAAAAKRPLAVFFHGLDASEILIRSPHYYDELFASGAGLITNSDYLKSRLVGAGAPAARVHIVPYGANPRLASDDTKPERSPRRVLTVARLVPKKGIDDALRAFARVRSELSEPWVFEIIGDGPMRAELSELASSLGISDTVEFRGALTRTQVFQSLRRASLFVLASKTAASGNTEGTPVAIIEACTLGRPVLSTLHAGIPEILPSEAESEGYLVKEGDVEALTSSLRRLMSDPQRLEQWALSCRAFAHARHSAAAHARGLLDVLKSAARVPELRS
jgi:colanic acid/amylovoran biosynthesis glycosyltransferase